MIASGNPTASASAERTASSGAADDRDADAASGPNSGPTTIAPTIRIGRVLEDADRREQRGDHHEREERGGELDVLVRARLDLLPHDRVRGRALRVLDRPLGVRGDLRVDLLERDRAVLVDPELVRSGEHHARVLARDVGEDHVALRVRRARSRKTTLMTDAERSSSSSAARLCRARATIRRWIMRARLPAPCPRARPRAHTRRRDHASSAPRAAAGARRPTARASEGASSARGRILCRSVPTGFRRQSAGRTRPPSVRPRPYLSEHMFPALTTSRPTKRSLRELVRGAVGTALEFATLGGGNARAEHRRAGSPAARARATAPRRPPALTRTAGESVSQPRAAERSAPARLPHAGTSPRGRTPAPGREDGAPDGLAPSPGRRTSDRPRARPAARRSTARPGGVPGPLTRRAARAARIQNRRRPTLPGPCEGQVPSALWGLTALFGMGRGVSPTPKPPEIVRDRASRSLKTAQPANNGGKNIRQALDPLVPVSYACCHASRSGLSTWWSTRGLTPSRGWESSSRGRLPA